MENVGEKSGKKISLVGVWLEGGEKKILVGPGNFLPSSTKMFSPQNGGENWEKNSHYIEQTKIPMRKGTWICCFFANFGFFFFFFLWLLKKRILSFCFAFLFLLCLFVFVFGFFFFGTFHYFIIITIIIFEAHLPLTCAPFKKNYIHHFLTKKMCYFLFYLIRI